MRGILILISLVLCACASKKNTQGVEPVVEYEKRYLPQKVEEAGKRQITRVGTRVIRPQSDLIVMPPAEYDVLTWGPAALPRVAALNEGTTTSSNGQESAATQTNACVRTDGYQCKNIKKANFIDPLTQSASEQTYCADDDNELWLCSDPSMTCSLGKMGLDCN